MYAKPPAERPTGARERLGGQGKYRVTAQQYRGSPQLTNKTRTLSCNTSTELNPGQRRGAVRLTLRQGLALVPYWARVTPFPDVAVRRRDHRPRNRLGWQKRRRDMFLCRLFI